MALGQLRVNGTTQAGSFYGYQPTFLLITGTNVGTADTQPGGGVAITEGNFTKAIRAIQTLGSIVIIGERHNDGFVVALDGATASDNGESTLAARVDTVVTAATGVSTTVAVKTLVKTEFA
jgi:hypothetical protein